MRQIKLFVFDVDNTITRGDTIWEAMHKACGTWKIAGLKFLEMYNREEISFEEFSRRDAKSWQGASEKLLHQVFRQIKIVPGFSALLAYLRKNKIKTAIVSCSVGQFAEFLAKKFKIDFYFANPLEIHQGKLSGKIRIKVTGRGKAKKLFELIKKLKLKKENIAVVGDSKFDVPMFNHSKHTFIIKNAKYKNEAKYFIKNFYEVLKLLKLKRFC